MKITDEMLSKLDAAALEIAVWNNSLCHAQGNQVGHLNDDGEFCIVLTVNTDQYDAEHFEAPIAQYYALANPEAIRGLINEMRECLRQVEALREEVAERDQTIVRMQRDLDDWNNDFGGA